MNGAVNGVRAGREGVRGLLSASRDVRTLCEKFDLSDCCAAALSDNAEVEVSNFSKVAEKEVRGQRAVSGLHGQAEAK